jgi:hypothetical protein
LAGLNRVEDVLVSHMYRDPICDNIIRLNDFLTFEHEAKLPDGSWLLIIFRYDSKTGLTADRVFDKAKFEDVTEEFKSHPYVLGAIRLIDEEIRVLEQQSGDF